MDGSVCLTDAIDGCRWDYGYQITTMGNRTVLVDNNTWNNTHIATVGLVSGGKKQHHGPSVRRSCV